MLDYDIISKSCLKEYDGGMFIVNEKAGYKAVYSVIPDISTNLSLSICGRKFTKIPIV